MHPSILTSILNIDVEKLANLLPIREVPFSYLVSENLHPTEVFVFDIASGNYVFLPHPYQLIIDLGSSRPASIV
jgi:hypothetical protein